MPSSTWTEASISSLRSLKALHVFIVNFFGGFIPIFFVAFSYFKKPIIESMIVGSVGYIITVLIVFIFNIAVHLKVKKNTGSPDGRHHNHIGAYPYEILDYNIYRNASIDYETLSLVVDGQMHIKMKSLSDSISCMTHSIGAGSNKAIDMKKATIAPVIRSFRRTSKGTITFEHRRNSESTMNWAVCFDPRLQVDEVAEYETEWNYKKGFLCLEEFMNAKAKSLIPADREYELLERTTSVPCERMVSRITFPVGYDIIDPSFTVKLRGIEIKPEISRIKDNGHFKVDAPTPNTGWVLELDIPYPTISLYYVIQWKPPKLASLVQNNLISETQREFVLIRMSEPLQYPATSPAQD